MNVSSPGAKPALPLASYRQLLLQLSCFQKWMIYSQSRESGSIKRKKKSLFTAFLLISFQDSRHNIWHRDFRFSEGCFFFTFRGMAAMKAEEKESGKQPPIRNAQHLACEYIRGHGVRCSFRRWHLFPRFKSPCIYESAVILMSCTVVPSVCFRSQGHILLPLKHHNCTAGAGHTAVSSTETTRLLLTSTIN